MNKDIYMKIVGEMSDRDVLSMLSVNKKFNDPEFFRQIMFQRYPLLVKYRKEGERWKMLYLRMVTYILKLKEEYNIDYIPAPSFNPKKFYYNLEVGKKEDNSIKRDLAEGPPYEFSKIAFLLHRIISFIGESGNENLIKDSIEKYNLQKNTLEMYFIISGIIKTGNLALLKRYDNYYNEIWYSSLEYAASSGNQDMIDYIKEKNNITYYRLEEIRNGSIKSGNLNLVKKYRYIDPKYIIDINENDNKTEYARRKGDCFGNIFTQSGSFEVFQYTLQNVCNFDDLHSFEGFVADEKIEWVRYFIDFYRKSRFYNTRDFKKILDIFKKNAIDFNAPDILKYINTF